jgi:hypothetical protein
MIAAISVAELRPTRNRFLGSSARIEPVTARCEPLASESPFWWATGSVKTCRNQAALLAGPTLQLQLDRLSWPTCVQFSV